MRRSGGRPIRGGARLGGGLGCVVLLLLLAATALQADPWRYTDEHGTVHFTDNPTNVLERYRATLEPLELDRAPELQVLRTGPAVKPAEVEAAAAAGLRQRLLEQARAQSGPGMPELEVWMKTWVVAFQIAGIPWSIISLGCMFQVLRRRRWGWFLPISVLWPVGMPAYLMFGLDEGWRRSTRALLLVLWSAPLAVMFAGFWLFVRQLG